MPLIFQFLFDDDTNIYMESSNLGVRSMNIELWKLWLAVCNRQSLNITKTNFVIFDAINKPKILINILINNKAIEVK